MSGTARSNIIPMPTAPAPTAPPPSLWPMPQITPGCCPPGGMDALMKCYCDIQAATAFICAVMVDCINTNPAVTEAIIAAIEKSGSSLPMIGVTNAADAQPGQVGELVEIRAVVAYATGTNTNVASLGSLPPGDWDCWIFGGTTTLVTAVDIVQQPIPAGFFDALVALVYVNGDNTANTFASGAVRALTSVPSLIAFSFTTSAATAGNLNMQFYARRRR